MTIPQEPVSGNITRINIRLPSGERVIRKFDALWPIKELYDFIETKDLSPIDILADIVVVTSYPSKRYTSKEKTFREVGLYPNATVLVEEFENDED